MKRRSLKIFNYLSIKSDHFSINFFALTNNLFYIDFIDIYPLLAFQKIGEGIGTDIII